MEGSDGRERTRGRIVRHERPDDGRRARRGETLAPLASGVHGTPAP